MSEWMSKWPNTLSVNFIVILPIVHGHLAVWFIHGILFKVIEVIL